MTVHLRNEVTSILRKYIGQDAVEDDTYLYHDLRISGDDAYDLLAEIQNTFGTSFEAMNFHEFFPAETEDIGSGFLRLIGIRSKYKSFSFGHLLRVIEIGSWKEP